MFEHAFHVYHIPKIIQRLPRVRQAVEEAVYMKPCTLRPLPPEGSLDLGGREIFFAETPGHTPGSICLADEKTGILFTGDNLCDGGILLAFEHSAPLGEYRKSLDAMQKMRADYHLNRIFPSHHKVDLPVRTISDTMECCDQILSGRSRGVYKDEGLNQGFQVKYKGISLIYREI